MDIWVGNLETNTSTRLTFSGDRGPTRPPIPFGIPSGKSICYGTEDGIFRKAADGTGDSVPLLLQKNISPADISPDGRYMIIHRSGIAGPAAASGLVYV